MKILIVTNIMTPYTKARLQELGKNKKYSITLFLQASNEPNRKWKYEAETIPGIKCKILPGIHLTLKRKDSFSFHFNPRVGKFIRKEAPDIVVIVGWNNPTTYLAARACKKRNIPIIAWSGSTKNEPHLMRKLAAPAIRWLHKQCNAFYAYGTAAKQLLTDHWGITKKKIYILGNPVNNEFFFKAAKKDPTVDKKLALDSKKQIILFVGQLIERKGVWELLNAFKEIKKQFSNTALVFAGNGPLKNKIEEKITQESLQDIYLPGYFSYDQLPALYNKATIFCLPSHEEVWGLVVNEAMASAVPVVVSDACGCVLDLIKHRKTGLCFKKADVKDLTLQLEYLLIDKKRRATIGQAGKTHIASWDIKRLAKIFFKAITETLKK